MPIRIASGGNPVLLEQVGFVNEEQLQVVLARTPALLRQEGEPALALVARELELPEAGYLDLLFVSSEGLPVAVEVKLEANSQSRREVVAQAVDYLSSLTNLTNDELEQLTQGKLSEALRSFEPETPIDLFERRWAAVGANLRAGLARLIVALDAAPTGLERLVRFLANSSQLDIQLVAIERYSTSENEVIVPRFLVSATSTQRRALSTVKQEAQVDLVTAVAEYNRIAEQDMQAIGMASYYRIVRPDAWQPKWGLQYQFYRTSKYLGVEVHIESDLAKPVAEVLRPLAGTILLENTPPLVWDASWSTGRGRLACRFAPECDGVLVARTMLALISRTRPEIDKAIAALSLP